MPLRLLEATRRDYWDKIAVTRTHAYMPQEVFDSLPKYNTSYPTGTRIGKRWKMQNWHTVRMERIWLDEWYMREYSQLPKHSRGRREDQIGVHTRRIVIVDA